MKTINELTFNKVVYYIKTKKVEAPEIEKQISDDLLKLFKNLMNQNEAYNYVAFGTKNDSIFLFINKEKIIKIIDFLEAKELLKSVEEISMDILMNRIKSHEFKETFIESDEFNHILDKFISENLTVNLVLDKINENGIDSLKKIDYEVLKSL